MKRINTLRDLRRERDYASKRLYAGLAKHGLTLPRLRYLGALDEELQDLVQRTDRLQRMIDHYGDEWAKDDWPHAIRARASAVGTRGCS